MSVVSNSMRASSSRPCWRRSFGQSVGLFPDLREPVIEQFEPSDKIDGKLREAMNELLRCLGSPRAVHQRLERCLGLFRPITMFECSQIGCDFSEQLLRLPA